MLRRLLPRIPLFRVSAPILPMSTRLPPRLRSPVSLTRAQPRPTSRLFHHFPARLSSPSSPTSSNYDPHSPLPPGASFSQKLKHLIKANGWYALGVYAVVGVLDFAVAFMGINLIGAEHVARFTASVKQAVLEFIHSKPPEPNQDQVSADIPSGGQEGLYAMLVLAYTVHKTLFLPVRVGFTAAFTPRLVHWLRARGWAGGEGTKRAAREVRDRMRRSRDLD